MTDALTLRAIQADVAAFVAEHTLETRLDVRALDLVSEVGEVAKELLKATHYGQQPATLSDNWSGELADVLFSLICLANSTNVDLSQSLTAVLEKYRQRLAAKGDAGSGS